MSQGKAFTPEQREVIIQSLQDWLELGFSRNKACAFIGLKANTLSNWVKEDEALGMKLVGWENANNKIAMSNIRDAMMKEGEMEDDLRKENSWRWVSAKEETMKPKQEIEQTIDANIEHTNAEEIDTALDDIIGTKD